MIFDDFIVEKVRMPLLGEMDTLAWRKHQGPQLMLNMAEYYGLMVDLLPSAWVQALRPDRLLNLMVDFQRTEPSPMPASSDLKALRAWMRQRQASVVSRGNVLVPETTQQPPVVQLKLDATVPQNALFTLALVDLGLSCSLELATNDGWCRHA